MRVLTIRLPQDVHERLRVLAAQRGISLNKLFEEFATRVLFEEFATRALTELDVETRFRVRAARGEAAAGLKLLDSLAAEFGDPDRRPRPIPGACIPYRRR